MTLNEIRNLENDGTFNYSDPQSYYALLKTAETDLRYVITWLKKGFQPDGHFRGVQRNDAYYVTRPYDPTIIERFMENKQANEAFEFVEKSYTSVEEMQESQRIEFEDSLAPEKMAAIRKAKKELDEFEMQIVLLSEQGRSSREIGEMLGINYKKVQRTKNKCRQKFEEIMQAVEKKSNVIKKKLFICHCNIRANDGQSHITARPTISVDAIDAENARIQAVTQLESQYRKQGCSWVDVDVPLIKEA